MASESERRGRQLSKAACAWRLAGGSWRRIVARSQLGSPAWRRGEIETLGGSLQYLSQRRQPAKAVASIEVKLIPNADIMNGVIDIGT
jgi:hypothetical protein